MAADPPFLIVRDLVKRFGPTTALDHVDLAIAKGEFFTLLGSSGCGKTTLLRAIAGFVEPDAGDVVIGGASVLPLPPYRRPVNMMFQSYALFPHMTVEDNIGFGLAREGRDRATIAARVADALDLMQMRPLARRKPHQLSGGQKQRVALARALIKQPQVLLLDEPLSALDKRLRESTQFELMNIQRQTGITFIMVTHDQQEAMTMSSRIAVMSAGRVVQIGTPEEIYEQPRTRFVADFIGTANMFEGRLTEATAERSAIDCDGLPCPLIGPRTAYSPGARLVAAVRPEHIRIRAADAGAGAGAGGRNRFDGRIASVVFLGDRRLYHVRLDAGPVVKVAHANDHPGGPAALSPATPVAIDWEPAATHLLEA